MATREWAKQIAKKLLGLIHDFDSGDNKSSPGRRKFESTLAELLKKHGSLSASRLQFLNLHDLIVRNNVDPEVFLSKAEKIIKSVIDDNLSEADSFVHYDVGAYGFLFPGLTLMAAELKCSVIADQVVRLLAKKDSTFSALEIEQTTKKFDVESLASRGVYSWHKARAVTTSRQDADQRPDVQRKRKLATQAFKQMTPRTQTDGNGSSHEPDLRWLEDQDSTLSQKLLPEGIDTIYRMVWNVNKKFLTAYSAHPVLRSANGKILTGSPVLERDVGHAALAQLDRFVQDEAVRKLSHLVDAGKRVLLILPVHFSTVDRHAYLAPYLQRISALRKEKKKLLVLELLDTPQDLPSLRIKDTIAQIRHTVRSVLVRVPPDVPRLTLFSEAEVHAVGFDWLDEPVPEKTLMMKMERFVERAEKAGLQTFIYGLTTLSMATKAVSAGFDYIEGDVVRQPVDTPENIQPFESKDLFSKLFSQ